MWATRRSAPYVVVLLQSFRGLLGMLKTRSYWIIILVLFLGLAGAKTLGDRAAEWTCWPGGYAQNAWMAYCNSERYGVYDIEAVWHHIEPEVVPDIAAARVLTLSDSHLQNALSLGGASEWFSAHHYRWYMLGLPHAQSGFGERLLDNLQPHADVVILDASPYFTGEIAQEERPMFNDLAASRTQVEELHDFQSWHQDFCSRTPWACGHNFAYFRSRLDGHWIFPATNKSIWIGHNSVPNDDKRFATDSRPPEDFALYPKWLENARRLVAKLPTRPSCIVITHVPSERNLQGLAQFIADGLGVRVVEPQVANLATFDNSHLTPQSSVLWTQAFLEQLEPVLHECISPGVTTAANVQ
jgi:hypothetical protein